MAVDRPINPENTVPLTDESPTDVQLVEDIGAEITPTEDGGAIVGAMEEEQIAVDFSTNLAEVLPDNELNSLSNPIVTLYHLHTVVLTHLIDCLTHYQVKLLLDLLKSQKQSVLLPLPQQ